MTNIKLKTSELKRIVKRCELAMSTEETRYYLNGVCLHYKKESNELYAVATNGHMLARIKLEAEVTSDKDFKYIVPRDMIKQLKSIKPTKDGLELISDVTIDLDDVITFKVATDYAMSQTIEGKLVDGTFPDYERVIPDSNTHLEIGFNPVYLEAIAKSIKDSKWTNGCKIYFSDDNNTPAYITSMIDGEEFVLMPMRV